MASEETKLALMVVYAARRRVIIGVGVETSHPFLPLVLLVLLLREG